MSFKRGKGKDEDDNVSEHAPPKKTFKKDTSGDDSGDEDNSIICDVSKNRRVSVKNWNGKIVVDIREFFLKDGKQIPGKKGISLNMDQQMRDQNPTTPIYAPNTDSQPESELEEEFVTETQPKQMEEELAIKRRRKSKKRAIPHPEEVFPSMPLRWKPDEIVCLVQCYLAVSKDEIDGNAQNSDNFWLRVLRLFHEKRGRGVYRNRDMLTAKWRETNIRVTRYNGIYTSLTQGNDVGDNDLTDKACEQYHLEMHHIWTLDECWKICKDHPKWVPIEGSSSQSLGSKRSRASATKESVESVSATRRGPLGRAAAKNAARGGGSLSLKQTKTNEDMATHIEIQRQRVELERLRIEELKLAREATERAARQENDRAIIAMDVSQFGVGEQRDMVIAMKLEAMERLRPN